MTVTTFEATVADPSTDEVVVVKGGSEAEIDAQLDELFGSDDAEE
jgi:hypothetical protein